MHATHKLSGATPERQQQTNCWLSHLSTFYSFASFGFYENDTYYYQRINYLFNVHQMMQDFPVFFVFSE